MKKILYEKVSWDQCLNDMWVPRIAFSKDPCQWYPIVKVVEREMIAFVVPLQKNYIYI